MQKLGLNAKPQLIFKKYTLILVGVRGVPGADSLHFFGDSYIGDQVRFVLVIRVGYCALAASQAESDVKQGGKEADWSSKAPLLSGEVAWANFISKIGVRSCPGGLR